MKVVAPVFSIALALAALGLSGARARAGVSDACAAPSPTYPSFCSIPRAPTDVRAPKAYRAAVIDVRVAARTLQRQSAQGWTTQPQDAAAFAAQARQEATAPPPMTDTATSAEAFASEGRERAAPPRKTH
jgi:hypothetical protein